MTNYAAMAFYLNHDRPGLTNTPTFIEQCNTWIQTHQGKDAAGNNRPAKFVSAGALTKWVPAECDQGGIFGTYTYESLGLTDPVKCEKVMNLVLG